MGITTLFRYFGGKSFVADEVWKRFGNPHRYIEPFCGTAAVLFKRPNEHAWWNKGEIINDLDGFITNVFRALKYDPDKVLEYAVWSKNEVDLHSRSAWLLNQQQPLTEKLLGDPFYYDPLIAGWWLWVATTSLSPRFFTRGGGWVQEDGKLVRNTDPERYGIQRSKPAIGYSEFYTLPPKVRNITEEEFNQDIRVQWLREFYHEVQRRLQRVSILCGDWKRVFVKAYYTDNVPTAVFLDPPYALDARDKHVYTHDHVDVTEEVKQWAIEHGSLPHFRIALCGFSDYLTMPSDWTPYYWTRRGGFDNQTNKGTRFKEVIWFSPHCLRPDQS